MNEQYSEAEIMAWLDSLDEELRAPQISYLLSGDKLKDFVDDLRNELEEEDCK